MKQYKLNRPIKDVSGENDIDEITVKEEDDLNASDFYAVVANPSGENLAETVANMCGLTSMQVASMSPKDYVHLSNEVGKYVI